MSVNSSNIEQLNSKIHKLETELSAARTKLEEYSTEIAGHEGLLQFAMDDMQKMYENLLKSQAQLMQADKLATIGLLSAGIAHEINNPLATLQLVFPMIQDHGVKLREALKDKRLNNLETNTLLCQEIEDYVQHGLLCVTTMSKIVRDIKMFSRTDKGDMNLESINSILESVLSIAWNALKGKVELHKEYGEVPLVRCNPQQLGQVFLNLIVNASQAMESKGSITLRTFLENGLVKTQISDTGSGIPQEILQRIFEPFFTTKGEEKGTGLGLSITFDIVKKHNGKIEVESEVGKGTTFTVSIPSN